MKWNNIDRIKFILRRPLYVFSINSKGIDLNRNAFLSRNSLYGFCRKDSRLEFFNTFYILCFFI